MSPAAWVHGRWRAVLGALRSVDTAGALRDLHIYGGLLIAAAGGWFGHAWPASRMWTAIALGAILTLFGLLAPARRTR